MAQEMRGERGPGRRASEADNQVPMYHTEHMLAYIFAAAAIVMGVLGLLVGFDVLASGGGEVAGPGAASQNFWDGLNWIIPAIAAAMVAYALHSSEHHLAQNPSTLTSSHRSMWNSEHYLAWLVGLATVALATIGILVGFDVINTGNSFDGLLWSFAAIGTGALTMTLHSVRHHQMASEEDYILGVVERGSAARGTARGGTQPGMERRS